MKNVRQFESLTDCCGKEQSHPKNSEAIEKIEHLTAPSEQDSSENGSVKTQKPDTLSVEDQLEKMMENVRNFIRRIDINSL